MDALEGVIGRHGAEGVPLVGPLPLLGLASASGLDVAGHHALHAREEQPCDETAEHNVPPHVAALNVGHPDGLVPLGVRQAGDTALACQAGPVKGEADDPLVVEAEVAVHQRRSGRPVTSP